MQDSKFQVPTEQIELPSKGLVYNASSELAKGLVEMKYMTAKEEDLLTNINNVKDGSVIDKLLKALIKSPIEMEDLLIGDRNALLIAARILAYGSEYTFSYGEDKITIDIQNLKNKSVDYDLFQNKNEFEFELPHSKNMITFKLLTVSDVNKIDEEIKGLRKAGLEPGSFSTTWKHQIIGVNGDRSTKVIRDFVDSGYFLSRDSAALRKYIDSINPDIDTTVTFTTKAGREVTTDLPMTVEFFFPWA